MNKEDIKTFIKGITLIMVIIIVILSGIGLCVLSIVRDIKIISM